MFLFLKKGGYPFFAPAAHRAGSFLGKKTQPLFLYFCFKNKKILKTT
jgi:hypothetical protein